MISIAYHSPLLSGGDGGGLFLFGTSFCVSPNSLLRKEKKSDDFFCFPLGFHYLCHFVAKIGGGLEKLK